MTNNKYTIQQDPNKKLEAKKYDKPIPSREMILCYLRDLRQPTIFENIAKSLGLKYEKQLKALSYRLFAMIRDKQIKREGKYFRTYDHKSLILTGYIRIETDGTTIFSSEDKTYRAILPYQQACLVFSGDKICATIVGINHKNKLEAKIYSIIERKTHEVVGRYNQLMDSHFIQPINKTMPKNIVLLPPPIKIKLNTLIKAKIIIFPSEFCTSVAQFLETLEEKSPVIEAISIASKKYNLIEKWSQETLKFVQKLKNNILSEEIIQRTDLRQLPFVTIDDEDAKDFDDAVYAHKSSTGGWKLYVAIADVSYFVRPNSGLDKDAQARSTSVYFPGYVFPMLPEKLSNNLCSLKPKEDRLAFICEMNISTNTKLSRYKFYSGIINSKARLTYNEVNNLINGNNTKIRFKQPKIIPNILNLYHLYKKLIKDRQLRGAIDFDVIKPQIILDKAFNISKISAFQRNTAHKVIEECMLLANVAAARFIKKNKSSAPFRVHNPPESKKIKDLQGYLKVLGIKFEPSKLNITPNEYNQMLTLNRCRDDFSNIQLMALKSMSQAFYTPDNNGHFGLAYPAYSHFTSPIRRYPDLLTHRIIKLIIGEKKFGAHHYTHSQISELCSHASNQERNADAASNEVQKWLQCYFLYNQIGKIFEGKIVHITCFGIYVELINNYIEGFIHISSMQDDYYIFNENQHLLIGKHTHKIFSIGQKLQVQLIHISLDKMQIDVEIVSNKKNSVKRKIYKHLHKANTKKNKYL